MRSVLITGTSSGIGRATAVVFASREWRVFATMRNLQKRSALEQALQEAGVTDSIEIEQLDVTSPASIQAPASQVAMQLNKRVDEAGTGSRATGSFSPLRARPPDWLWPIPSGLRIAAIHSETEEFSKGLACFIQTTPCLEITSKALLACVESQTLWICCKLALSE